MLHPPTHAPRISFSFAWLCLAGVLSGCTSTPPSDTPTSPTAAAPPAQNPAPQANTRLVVYTAAEDQELMLYQLEEHQVLYLGTKDPDGLPTRVDRVVVDPTNSSKRVFIQYDSAGRPVEIVGADGAYLAYDWERATVALTLTDGKVFATTFPNTPSAGSRLSPASKLRPLAISDFMCPSASAAMKAICDGAGQLEFAAGMSTVCASATILGPGGLFACSSLYLSVQVACLANDFALLDDPTCRATAVSSPPPSTAPRPSLPPRANSPNRAMDDSFTMGSNRILSVAAPGVLQNDVLPNGIANAQVQFFRNSGYGNPPPAGTGSFQNIGNGSGGFVWDLSRTPNLRGQFEFFYVIHSRFGDSNIASIRVSVQ